MCAGLKRSMPCDNLNELEVAQQGVSAAAASSSSSFGRFFDDSACDFKRQRLSLSSVSVASSSDDDCSQASPASSDCSSSPATAALEEALALSSDFDIVMPEMDSVQVFFDFSFQDDFDSSLQNVDDMTRAMVRMSTISNKA